MRSLFQDDLLWPTFALVSAVALANYITLSFLGFRVGQVSNDSSPVEPTASKVMEESMPEPPSRELQRLSRSVERLDMVERDLIRKMSDTFPIDSATQQLLTEMRICTNRLRGQLSDIEQPLESRDGNLRNRSSKPQQSKESHSPSQVTSDMKFDNVPVA